MLALAACGGGDGGGPPFTNPVHAAEFPDPFVLEAEGTWYAYATNGPGGNVQLLSSSDLVHWKREPDALPEVGAWAYEGKTWAPEAIAVDGSYVLYYTANGADYGTQCVGRAVATSPKGPFRDDAKQPLVCQKDEGGTIDASPFRDEDGTIYLLYKNDGNCCAKDTWIWIQELTDDGTSLVGEPTRLLKQGAAWEANVVEAPTMWRHDGRYYLFYSGNAFDSDFYATGYAACDSPTGPCTKAEANPILMRACDAGGPGHQALFEKDGETWIAYHAWNLEHSRRELWLDRLVWDDGKPIVDGPTCEEQPGP